MSRILFLIFFVSAGAMAQEPLRCDDDDKYSQLDFWVGEWDVWSGDELAGTNVIEKTLGGCAVLEHWTGAGGGEGKSLFYVDGGGMWQQVWVTEWSRHTGGVKEKTWQSLDNDKQVRFQGEISLPDGGSYLDRTTLTDLGNGEVRQLIEVSRDGGETWEATFDAVYRPSSRTGHG
jgi:hypothetical protein